jgi:hypothetical protein
MTNCGVPQGSILSPLLFDIFINDLAKEVNELRDGVALGECRVSCLLYADDIALLSNSPAGLQRMLTACQAFARKARFNFNLRKSNIVVFTCSDAVPRPALHLNNHPLEHVPNYVYLGVEFGTYVYIQKGTRFELYLKRIIREATRRSREVLSIAREHDSQAGLPIHICLLYFQTHVRSRLEYACQVWGPLITPKQRKRLDAVQNEFLRHALRLPGKTPIPFLLGELDTMPLWLRHQEQALRYWGNICTMPRGRLPRQAQLQYLNRSNQKHQLSTWSHSIYKLIQSHYPALAHSLSGSLPAPAEAQAQDLDETSKVALTRRLWAAQVAKVVRERWCVLWAHELSELSSLRYYHIAKTEPSLEPWLKDTNHAGIHAKLLLRTGKLLNTSHPRWPDNRSGLCRLCPEQAAETRAHFLLSCPALEHLRQAWARDLKFKMAPSPEQPYALSALLNQWASSAHIDLAPSASRPTFVSPTSYSTVQICSLLHPSSRDLPLPPHDPSDDEQASGILRTMRKFEALLEKSTRILLHKMTKLRQQFTSPDQRHPLH